MPLVLQSIRAHNFSPSTDFHVTHRWAAVALGVAGAVAEGAVVVIVVVAAAAASAAVVIVAAAAAVVDGDATDAAVTATSWLTGTSVNSDLLVHQESVESAGMAGSPPIAADGTSDWSVL